MLKIRLQRTGRKHEPTFRVVLTESKNSTKSGKFLELLGSFDPRQKDATKLNAERIKHWISKGVQLSETIHNLLITHKIIEGTKINVLPKKTPIVKEQPKEEAKTEEVKPEETVTEEAKTEEVKPEEKAEEITPTETPAEEKTGENIEKSE